jgi:tetratricopeptide (TPR) repeat protein
VLKILFWTQNAGIKMKQLTNFNHFLILSLLFLSPSNFSFSATNTDPNLAPNQACLENPVPEKRISCLTAIISSPKSLPNEIIEALLLRAVTYGATNQHEKSMADFKTILVVTPKDDPAMAQRGALLATAGQIDLAMQAFDQALTSNPKDLAALNARAVTQAQQQNYRSAIADFSRILEIDPANIEALRNRGSIMSDLKQNDLAIRDLSLAIKLNPSKDFRAFYARANAYNERGNFRWAVKDYNTVLELFPQLPEALLNRGSILQFQGKYNTALKDFDALLQIDPENFGAFAHNGRCWSFIFLKQLETAMVECNESLKLNDQISETYDSRALLYEKLGKLDLAEADYQKSHALKPSNIYAIDGLKRVKAAKK